MKSWTNAFVAASSRLSPVARYTRTEAVRCLPANSPAQGTSARRGSRSRSRNIYSRLGFARGAGSSHPSIAACNRSPTNPPNRVVAPGGHSSTGGACMVILVPFMGCAGADCEDKGVARTSSGSRPTGTATLRRSFRCMIYLVRRCGRCVLPGALFSPPGCRRINSRLEKAQSPPARTPETTYVVGGGRVPASAGDRAFSSREFIRRQKNSGAATPRRPARPPASGRVRPAPANSASRSPPRSAAARRDVPFPPPARARRGGPRR